jgi:hypothetical protein
MSERGEQEHRRQTHSGRGWPGIQRFDTAYSKQPREKRCSNKKRKDDHD